MKITKRQLRQIISEAINEGRDNNLAELYSPIGDGSLDTLTTDQVEFEYGMYTGSKYKGMPYYISIDSEQELGDIQRRGDPYTYTAAGSGKMKVVSGPAKDTLAARRWMGVLVQNPEAQLDADTKSFATKGGVFSKPTAPTVNDDGPGDDADILAQRSDTQDKKQQPSNKKYKATKEQVANFGMELVNSRNLNYVQKNQYKSLAKRVRTGSIDKDRALETFFNAPGIETDEIQAAMSAVGLK